MSENDLDPEHPDIVQMRDHIKNLEKQVKDLAPKAERADTAERTLAFAKAGIDISTKKAGYFIAGYDGELDPEKIKEAAIEDGFLDAPAPEPDPGSEDAAALAARAEAMGGTPPAPPGFEDRLKAAKSMAEVDQIIAESGMTPAMHGS